MLNRLLLPVVLLSLVTAGGCLVLDTKRSEPAPAAYVAPATTAAVQADPATLSRLQDENAQLRAQRDKLEQDYRQWQLAVDARQNELDTLKQQREQLKKERDRYKKAFEND